MTNVNLLYIRKIKHTIGTLRRQPDGTYELHYYEDYKLFLKNRNREPIFKEGVYSKFPKEIIKNRIPEKGCGMYRSLVEKMRENGYNTFTEMDILSFNHGFYSNSDIDFDVIDFDEGEDWFYGFETTTN